MSAQQSFEVSSSPGLPEMQYCPVGQLEVPYVEYGTSSEEERPIVLLNGISMPPDHFGRLPHELVKLGHHVVAVGVPEGEDKPAVSTMGWYADMTKRAIHEITGEQPYDLLGLSWGGFRAQVTANKDPLIGSLVLAATLPRFLIPLNPPNLSAMKGVASTKRGPDAVAAILGGDLGEDKAEILRLMNRKIHKGEHFRQMGAAALSQVTGFMDIQRARGIPTLFILGEHDPLIPTLSVAISAMVMGAEVQIIKNTGHAVLMTHAEESAGIIHSFLGRGV